MEKAILKVKVMQFDKSGPGCDAKEVELEFDKFGNGIMLTTEKNSDALTIPTKELTEILEFLKDETVQEKDNKEIIITFGCSESISVYPPNSSFKPRMPYKKHASISAALEFLNDKGIISPKVHLIN